MASSQAPMGTKINNVIPADLQQGAKNVDSLVSEFIRVAQPFEAAGIVNVFMDGCTSARFCECHISASKLIELSTIDVPLDPDEQGEYRANREIVADHSAFEAMKEDAQRRRTFSNIVAEFTTEFDEEHPLKIIGGQHRFEAIKGALTSSIDEYHGVKVYFGLSPVQRLDVQLVSNTVIAVSSDLLDRMQETLKGPELRDWCQKVGLLDKDQDFADRRQRGAQLTVRAARSFIMNYYRGRAIRHANFASTESIPIIARSGKTDPEWDSIRAKKTTWKDAELQSAGENFAALVAAQRTAFSTEKKKLSRASDSQEKALSYPILTSWAYVAGLLSANSVRLKRHYELAKQKGRDPLNADALASARHKSDPTNYRGLGTRTSPKDLGRLVELFYIQAESGKGITKPDIDLAMKSYHAKEAMLDLQKAKETSD